jgi:transposase
MEKTTATIAPTAGIDIAKDRLDVALHPAGETRQFGNDRHGHGKLLRWLRTRAVACVIFEATGAYGRDLERRLEQSALPFARVNPRHARWFAEATGRLAKTDRVPTPMRRAASGAPVDALMLARFGAALARECRPLRSETLDQLAELVAARRALVKDRTATLNRQKTVRVALLTRQAARRLTQIDAQIRAIDAAARALIEGDPDLDRRRAILESIRGFGETTAIALLAEMPELGTLDEKQAAALAGLAPMTRQSGKWKGKSKIQGGRGHVRQTLVMPAMVAARFNAERKAKLETLTKAGKPAEVAITAVMRKLVVLANALLRDDRLWTPKPARPSRMLLLYSPPINR